MKHHANGTKVFALLFIVIALLIAGLVVQAQDYDKITVAYTDLMPDTTVTNLYELVERIEPRVTSNVALAVRKYSPQGDLEFSLTSNPDLLYPIASGFKGWLGLYYLLETPQEQWDIEEGSDIYSMVVFSNNTKTGRVLDSLGIEDFNDFLLNEIGMENGIGRWGYGNQATDERFMYNYDRNVYLKSGQIIQSHNNMTLTDLIIGYEYFIRAHEHPRWETDEHYRNAIETAQYLMSIRAEEFPTPFESIVRMPFSYGKEGALRPEDGLGIHVINESLVLETPDGSSILIALMTVGETHGLFRYFAERIFTWIPELEDELASELYELDFSMYPRQTDFEVGELYYGFVIPSKVDIYYEPTHDAKLENYFRNSYTMPTAYVYHGALMRIEMLEDGWGRVVRNSPQKEVFREMLTTPHWGEVYMQVEDLHVIDFEHFAPIDSIYGKRKWFVIDKHTNTIVALEGDQVVVSSPVVLNKALTEEGLHMVNTNMASLDMPYYPGVPFVMNFGLNENLGLQAIHGAPWQKSSLTLKDGVAETRTTGGCVNLPNWVVPIHGYEMPFDEFMFRWTGGMDDPHNIYEQRNTSVEDSTLVIIVNGWEDLEHYHRVLSDMGLTVNEAIDLMTSTPLTVPDSYWS